MSTDITYHPILFSGPMVRAILDGTKTQTRRVIKPQPPWDDLSSANGRQYGILKDGTSTGWTVEPDGEISHYPSVASIRCPYGVAGERLWVRETFIVGWDAPDGDLQRFDEDGNELPEKVWYAADDNGEGFTWLGDDGEMLDNIPWKPSIHMPRWASRLTLEVLRVRVQRVQEISEVDAKAEGLLQRCGDVHPGVSEYSCGDGAWTTKPRTAFMRLWDSINGKKHPWDANPWVWAVDFRRVEV